MSSKTKRIIEFIVGIVLIITVLCYLAIQFASINTKLKQVVSTDIPIIKNRLISGSTATEEIEANVKTLTGNFATWENYKESIREIERNIEILTKKINDETHGLQEYLLFRLL